MNPIQRGAVVRSLLRRAAVATFAVLMRLGLCVASFYLSFYTTEVQRRAVALFTGWCFGTTLPGCQRRVPAGVWRGDSCIRLSVNTSGQLSVAVHACCGFMSEERQQQMSCRCRDDEHETANKEIDG